ncbi:unnamed protein product [Gordionus sp. m RMFG-2023]
MRTLGNREYCVISLPGITVAGKEANDECLKRGYRLWSPKAADDLIFWAKHIEETKHGIVWRIGFRLKGGKYYYEDKRQGRFDFSQDSRFTLEDNKECLFLKRDKNINYILQKSCDTIANYICAKKSLFIYADCTNNSDCWKGGNMVCKNKKCQCEKNSTPAVWACKSKNQSYCLPTRYGDQPCQPNQCGRGLNCSVLRENHNGTCKCLPNFIKDPDKDKDFICYEPIKLGKPCECTKECKIHDPLSYCAEISLKYFCKCIKESYYLNGKCHKRSELYGICSSIDHCQNPNLKCLSGKCVCNDGYYLKEKVCLKSKAYNEPCDSNEECFATHPLYHCSSRSTYIPTQIVGLQKIKKFVNYHSSSFRHSRQGVSSKKCQCIPTATYKFEKCISASINTSCDSDSDCHAPFSPFSECTTDSICMCKKGYVLRSPGCHTGTVFGADCSSDSDCDYQGAACHNKQCFCSPSYFPKNSICHKRISFQNPCTKEEDCQHLADNSNCIQEKCKCNHGYYDERYKECRPDKHFGDYCDYKEECKSIKEGVTCLYTTCDCDLGMYRDKEKCVMGKHLGTACDNINQCNKMVQVSGCIGSKCTCENSEKNDTLYTCLPAFDSYDCAINIKFDIEPPIDLMSEFVRIKYVETRFLGIYRIAFGTLVLRLNLAYKNDSHYRISMILYLNNSLGINVVELTTTHTKNYTNHVLANGDVTSIKTETFQLLPVKGECLQSAVALVPKMGSNNILIVIASILFLLVLLALLLIFALKYLKYNAKTDYPWKYKSGLPPPFIPPQGDMLSCLEKARRLPMSITTGKINMNALAKIYMTYFYQDYYDFNYNFYYDLAHKYLPVTDPEIETMVIELYAQDEEKYYPLMPGDIPDDIDDLLFGKKSSGKMQEYDKGSFGNYEASYEYEKALSEYEYQYQ